MTIPTLDELVEEVQGTIKDTSAADEDTVIKHFNRALFNVANRLHIPNLFKVGTVSTVVDSNVTPLPDDYHKNLRMCYNVTKKSHVRVHESRILIDRRLGSVDMTGNIHSVAKDGSNLYYQGIPASIETLQISYQKLPISVSIEMPTYIPEDIFEKLIVNYACQHIWSSIEDGIEGEKTNTLYHKSEYKEAYSDAFNYFGPEEDEPYVPLRSNPNPGNFDFNGHM